MMVALKRQAVIVGKFVYHCHILSHEDKGMMAVIEVKPRCGMGGQKSEACSGEPEHRNYDWH